MDETSNTGRLVNTALAISILCIILYVVNYFTAQSYVRLHFIGMWFGLIYIAASWRWTEQVQAGYTAVLQRFGKIVDVLEPGLHFAPLWIYKLQMVDMQIKQNELPDEPENIWTGDIDKIEPGKKPALRIPFRNIISEEQAIQIFGDKIVAPDGTRFQANIPEDGLSRRVTAQVVPVVEYIIRNPKLFVERFANEAELKKVLEDEVFRVINILLPNVSIGQALANKAWINSHLIKAIEDRISRDGADGKDWGVDIIGAYIKNIPIHHSLNSAIGEASEAEFKGRAISELTIAEGKGKAKAARDLEAETLKGRAEGLKEAMAVTGLTAQEIQAAEVARAVGQSGSTVVVGGEGFGQLLGIAAATLGKNGQNPDQKGKP